MKTTRSLTLSILSGALLALSFPPIPFFLFAFVALVPLLYALEQEPRPKHTFLMLYLAFFVYHAGGNWWIGSWQADTDPYLTISAVILSIVHPVFYFVPFWAYFRLRRNIGSSRALYFLPFIWTAFEWLHSLSDFSYPWLTIGNTQAYNRLWVQIIDITGVWGSSFLIVMANVLCLKLIYSYKSGKESDSLNRAGLLVAFGAVLLAPMIYGAIRMPQYSHQNVMATHSKKLTIGLIQPNINPWRKWEGGGFEQINKHIAIQDSLRKQNGHIDLSIWSETAIPYIGYDVNSAHDLFFLQKWLDSTQTSLMTGFTDVHFFRAGEQKTKTAKKLGKSEVYYESYNSALLLNPSPSRYRNPQLYYKTRLTPFAERLPFAEYLTFAAEWFKWGVGISSWGKGFGAKALTVMLKNGDSVKIGPIVCIESIYPEYVSGFVNDGAEVLSVITNDAWYDHTPGPEQHFIIAEMRAMENRRYVARCANTGVTGFIAPDGTEISRVKEYSSLGISAEIAAINDITIYTRFGDWLPWFCFIIVMMALIAGNKIFRHKKLNN